MLKTDRIIDRLFCGNPLLHVRTLCSARFGHLLLMHPFLDLSPSEILCPPSPPPRPPLSLSLLYYPESHLTDNRLIDCIVLVTVCDPFSGFIGRSLYSISFYLEYCLMCP